MNQERRRSPPLHRRFLYGMATLVVFLGLAEGGARLLGRGILRDASSPTPPAVESAPPQLQGNPYLLWEMVPGTIYEMGVKVHINGFGLRGPETTLEKPAGLRRAMTLGDSSVFGFGVEDDQVFTALLAKAWAPAVEVINSAIPGYSTYQTLNLLQIRSLALDPDLVIIANLWSDNNFDSFVDKDLLAAYGSFGNSSARRTRAWLDRSALFRVLDYKIRVVRKFPASRRVGWMVGRGGHIGKRRVEINEFAVNIETIVELSHERGAEVLFLVLPNNEDLNPNTEGPPAWEPYRKVLRDAAARHGAPLVDMPSVFVGSGIGKELLFIDEMHPTPQGHALMAETLRTVIEGRGWLEGRPLEVDPAGGPIPTYDDPFIKPPPEPPKPDMGAPVFPVIPLDQAPTVKGTVLAPQFKQGLIQLDFLDADTDTPQVLATTRLKAPGPFEVRITKSGARFRVMAYLDATGDGPGPGDTRVELLGDPVEVPVSGAVDVTLDLSQGRTEQTFADDQPRGATQ